MTKRDDPEKLSHYRLPGIAPSNKRRPFETVPNLLDPFNLKPRDWLAEDKAKPRGTSWENNPNLPPHLKRRPGETLLQQEDRIAAYLNARYAARKGQPLSKRTSAYPDEKPPEKPTHRDCGACDGRGRYNGIRCTNCFGTGRIRLR